MMSFQVRRPLEAAQQVAVGPTSVTFAGQFSSRFSYVNGSVTTLSKAAAAAAEAGGQKQTSTQPLPPYAVRILLAAAAAAGLQGTVDQ